MTPHFHRALLLLPESPFPPQAGNAIRDAQHVAILRRLGWVPMLALASTRRDLTPAQEASALGDQIALSGALPVCATRSWPETVARKLSYATFSDAHPFAWWLDRVNLSAFFVDAVRQVQPRAVIARSLFLHVVPEIRRVFDGHLVIDCHDADEFLARELMRTVPISRRAGPWANWRGVRRVTRRHLEAANEVWAVSAIDQQRMTRLVPGAAVSVVPSGMAALPQPCVRTGKDRRVLMVANFTYGPNASGAAWLLRDVWPAVIAAYPEARLVIAGRGAVAQLSRASTPPGVDLIDPAPDLSRLYDESAIVVAPIHHGSGTRLKIVDACRHGKAVVTTGKGVEGLEVVRHAVVVADTPNDFAKAVIDLLTNRVARHRLGSEALTAFDRHLSHDAVAATLGAYWRLPGTGGAACA
jgi:glycosyltransferase involved in cell wall biosynthesis